MITINHSNSMKIVKSTPHRGTISLESLSELICPAHELLKTLTANRNPPDFKEIKHLL